MENRYTLRYTGTPIHFRDRVRDGRTNTRCATRVASRVRNRVRVGVRMRVINFWMENRYKLRYTGDELSLTLSLSLTLTLTDTRCATRVVSCRTCLYLPKTPSISLYLPISPPISPRSPKISLDLPSSPIISPISPPHLPHISQVASCRMSASSSPRRWVTPEPEPEPEPEP